MIDFIWDQGFKRRYKKIVADKKEIKESFWKAVERFSKDPFDPHLRTHKLTGKLKGLWSFTVNYDCRVIFRFLSDQEVLLIDIGGHDEVY